MFRNICDKERETAKNSSNSDKGHYEVIAVSDTDDPITIPTSTIDSENVNTHENNVTTKYVSIYFNLLAVA